MYETINGNKEDFNHPFGYANDILASIDRVCWRLPDIIRAEGGLELHLDRNSFQAFVTLTL